MTTHKECLAHFVHFTLARPLATMHPVILAKWNYLRFVCTKLCKNASSVYVKVWGGSFNSIYAGEAIAFVH